jgi:hypothetical protein
MGSFIPSVPPKPMLLGVILVEYVLYHGTDDRVIGVNSLPTLSTISHINRGVVGVVSWTMMALLTFVPVARRFAEEFGVMRLSAGEALRWVLCNQPNTDLSKCIQSYLFNGFTVPDECTVQALEVVLMSTNCRTRG